MINLRSTTSKRQEAAVQVRIALQLEHALARRARLELDRVARKVSDHFRRSGRPGDWLHEHRLHLAEILGSAYRPAIRAMFERARTAKPKSQKDSPPNAGDVDAAIRLYIDTHGGTRVTQISDATALRIAEAIQEGVDEELSYDKVAKLIEDRVGGTIGADRAEVIARTETHGAMQYGSLMGVQASGADVRSKEWVAVEDARTRDAHSAADGQVVDIADPFEVGDEELDYPGDPSGSPENVINCRCAMVYHTTDSEST